jgi:hypothetical protein
VIEAKKWPSVRMMYDAADPANIPARAEIIAWYPGMWKVTAAEAFPRAIAVSVAQHPDQLDCDVLDIERFDATVDDLPGWIEAKRKRHDRWHGAYCSLDIAAGVVPILRRTGSGLWCAEWTGEPHPIVVEGFTASAVQYLNNKEAGFDLSAVYESSWHRAP